MIGFRQLFAYVNKRHITAIVGYSLWFTPPANSPQIHKISIGSVNTAKTTTIVINTFVICAFCSLCLRKCLSKESREQPTSRGSRTRLGELFLFPVEFADEIE